MNRNTSISLGKHFDTFISKEVISGRFGTVSEVIRAGLRLLEEREEKLMLLRAALMEGERSGLADYSLEALIQQLDETNL